MPYDEKYFKRQGNIARIKIAIYEALFGEGQPDWEYEELIPALMEIQKGYFRDMVKVLEGDVEEELEETEDD